MTAYTALVYPQTLPEQSYTRPPIPSTFVSLALVSPSWNPYGTQSINRTEWWEDTAGVLIWDNVLFAAYGAAGLASQQIAAIRAAYAAAVAQPVSYTTTAGTTATFDADPGSISLLGSAIDAGSSAWSANLWLSSAGAPITPFAFSDLQGLAAAIEARDTPDYQEMLKLIGQVDALAGTPAWAASTAYASGAQIVDPNGNIWSASAAETSGATAPAWPLNPASGATQADGSVTWKFVSAMAAAIQAVVWP